MTDEHEHERAMKVWREACDAYEDNSHDLTLSIRERTISGDQAAAAVIAADRAGLVAEIERLREALLWCSGSNDFNEGGVARRGWLKLCAPLLHRAALKDTRHDADA